jgi:3-oxoacyl-[acyl-carrier-protein] synthase-1
MSAVTLGAMGMVCALGREHAEIRRTLEAGIAPGMRPDPERSSHQRPLWTGQVDGPLPELSHLPPRHRSRNNQLLLAALAPIREQVDAAIRRFGPLRVGVVLGTSTSGIAETEAAFFHQSRTGAFPERFHYSQMEIGSPSQLLCEVLGILGPAHTVSTACSSSAKALLGARRLLEAGLCDAVIAGGADSLCRFTLAGFGALEAVAEGPCRPFQADRAGINIGEGAALFLVTRDGPGPRLLGGGESSDAHHVSAPHPEGEGAARALSEALEDAKVAPDQVDYVNAHGTATPQNDAMESRAIRAVIGPDVPVSSTKPLTGHTLGAAGAIEAGLCWLLLSQPGPVRLPAQLPEATLDPSLAPLRLVAADDPPRRVHVLVSCSFGFGGSNAALVFGRGE